MLQYLIRREEWFLLFLSERGMSKYVLYYGNASIAEEFLRRMRSNVAGFEEHVESKDVMSIIDEFNNCEEFVNIRRILATFSSGSESLGG
jgi:hypothetical protein